MRALQRMWLIALCTAPMLGCEAVADFDRSRIPGPTQPTPLDGSVEESDAGDDDAGSTQPADASMPSDAALDAATDAVVPQDASDDDAGDDDAG